MAIKVPKTETANKILVILRDRIATPRVKSIFEDKFAEYSQKSEEELTARLMDVARRMKAQGTFDAQSLENLYNNAYPMLNDEQRRRMRSIIDMLKA